MEFGLTPEQVALADTVRRYLADQCPTDRVRAIMESDSGHDVDLWRGLMELGVGALPVPEQHGGMAAELLDLALVSEELGFACAPGPFLGCALATVALAAGDDEEAKARWLPAIAAGETLATVAIGESGSRWDAHELQARAGNGRLSASKPLVPYASLSRLHVVAATDGGEAALFLVESDAAGVEMTALSGNDRTRRLEVVEYRDVQARRIGGTAAFERVRDAALVLIAADAFGGARRCLEMARTYALQREQFGQVIGAFQAVKHQLANLAVDLEPGLSLWWYAAHSLDALPEQAPRHAAMAKAHLCDLFDRAARDSTELHGGIGFTWEFDLHLWLRRSLFDRSFFGDSHYHRARAARLAGW
ncbi:MAG TPA: acyl-CoA dehydrogenase family protein [Candidatus Limnocylindrales bacterium]|nr:acyl-CoA dehydrogenase family protein [Candidatus Limnocylindrales bacterium]